MSPESRRAELSDHLDPAKDCDYSNQDLATDRQDSFIAAPAAHHCGNHALRDIRVEDRTVPSAMTEGGLKVCHKRGGKLLRSNRRLLIPVDFFGHRDDFKSP